MKSKLSVDQINYLNILLMLMAAAAAFVRPFELFLLAYAILGPLHYLSEISWLHDKRYYTRGRNDYLFLLLAGALITAVSLGVLPELASLLASRGIRFPVPPPIERDPQALGAAMTLVAFGSALVFALTGKARPRLLLIPLLALLSGLIVRDSALQSLFGLLLPTIVHVFLFTGLFILVGALKGRSASGIASLVVFVLCSVAFFLFAPGQHVHQVGEYVRGSYQSFAYLNYALMTPFSHHNLAVPANVHQYIRFVNTVLYRSPSAYAVMGFIAFAYTYHYLNWFSKTSIIQWHHIPRSRLAAVIVLWAASIACYASDYRLGLRWLFFLSLSHVLLEFPLNHLSFVNIGKELRKLLVPSRPKARSAGLALESMETKTS